MSVLQLEITCSDSPEDHVFSIISALKFVTDIFEQHSLQQVNPDDFVDFKVIV